MINFIIVTLKFQEQWIVLQHMLNQLGYVWSSGTPFIPKGEKYWGISWMIGVERSMKYHTHEYRQDPFSPVAKIIDFDFFNQTFYKYKR